MTTLTTYFECVQYFKGRMEKCGYQFDFIDNVYTGRQFVVINGCRALVQYEGKGISSIPEVYYALQRACKSAYQQAVDKGLAKQFVAR